MLSPGSSISPRAPKNMCSCKTQSNSQLLLHAPSPWIPLSHGWDFPPLPTKPVTYWSTILEQASPQSQWYSCWMMGTFSWTHSTVVKTPRCEQNVKYINPYRNASVPQHSVVRETWKWVVVVFIYLFFTLSDWQVLFLLVICHFYIIRLFLYI